MSRVVVVVAVTCTREVNDFGSLHVHVSPVLVSGCYNYYSKASAPDERRSSFTVKSTRV